jgi:hypothetical protein
MTTGKRLDIDIDEGLIRLRSDYDPDLIDRIRALPDRRYIRERQEWVAPARRRTLTALVSLIEAVEGSVDTAVTRRAARRLKTQGPGQITTAGHDFQLTFGYSRRRLELVRALPDRQFDPTTKTWIVASTRAGALGLLELIATYEFRAQPPVLARLQQLAKGLPPAPAKPTERGSARRRSPRPHWRQVTRGPIFQANRARREWVQGVGWCVRIRVDPRRRRDRGPPTVGGAHQRRARRAIQ